MDEPIDAVALGLKRGPRGAVCVALLVVATPLALVAMRSKGGSAALTARQVQPALDELAPLTPLPPAQKRSRVKRTVQPKPTPLVARRAPAVAETSPKPQAEAARREPEPEPIAVVERAEPRRPENVADEEFPPLPPPVPPPEPEGVPEPDGDGNGEAIARAIAAEKRAAVRACFESELKQSPKLRGTVVVELDLAPPNRVDGVRVNDDLERASFTSCVAATMRDVRFASLDEEISVSVPYVLTPAAK